MPKEDRKLAQNLAFSEKTRYHKYPFRSDFRLEPALAGFVDQNGVLTPFGELGNGYVCR
jgi:hypothetical protein